MLRYRIAEQNPGTSHLYGATMGQAHLRSMLTAFDLYIAGSEGSRCLVQDFTGAESCTASYLKATTVWLLEAGRLAAEEAATSPETDPTNVESPWPLDVFPMVVGMNEEISGEFGELLERQGRACLEITRWGEEKAVAARLRGTLDPSLRWTLDALTRERRATASLLHERYAADPRASGRIVSANAWNNRLSDLHRLRLANRAKEGRHWVYQPTVAEVTDG